MRPLVRRFHLVALAAPLLLVGLAAPAESTGPSALTRIRIVMESTSDWAAVDLLGAELLERRTIETSPGTAVDQGATGFAVRAAAPGVVPSRVVVDAVAEVDRAMSPTLRIRKGYLGVARVELHRINSGSVLVATAVNDRVEGDYTLEEPVSPAALVGEGLTIPRIDPRRLVLSFYYPWFDGGPYASGSDVDEALDADDTGDPAAVQAMVDQAQRAGIDGFVVSWDGDPDHADRFDIVLDRARSGFSVAPYIELPITTRKDGLDALSVGQVIVAALQRSSHPSFLHVGDRPVLFLYGTWALDHAEWTAIRTALRLWGLDPFVVGDTLDTDFELDGYHIYDPNRLDGGVLTAFNRKAAYRLRLPSQLDSSVPQRLWAATVSPGADTRASNPLTGFHRDRAGGARYDETWAAALASAPEWVLVTSWNEWTEATQVMPSALHGRRALDQTRGWAASFDATHR